MKQNLCAIKNKQEFELLKVSLQKKKKIYVQTVSLINSTSQGTLDKIFQQRQRLYNKRKLQNNIADEKISPNSSKTLNIRDNTL